MHIVCPHCTTSYAIKLASLGANGRTVRCSRCKETWMAHPEDAIEEAAVPAMATASQADDEWSAAAREAEEEVVGAQHQSWFSGLFSRRGAKVSRPAPAVVRRKS